MHAKMTAPNWLDEMMPTHRAAASADSPFAARWYGRAGVMAERPMSSASAHSSAGYTMGQTERRRPMNCRCFNTFARHREAS